MSKKNNDVVIIDDGGILSLKLDEEPLLPVDTKEDSDDLATPTETPEPEIDEESPKPLDTAKDFAEKTEH